MKVLVTGHNGYLGSVLVPLLQRHGHQVFGLDSNLFAGCHFGPLPSLDAAVDGDIRDVHRQDLPACQALVHLAGLSNDPLGSLHPAVTHDINCRATIRLAGLAKQAGIERFVFSSTCSNYGASGDAFVAEDAPLQPLTPYATSKVAAERELTCLADDSFSPIILRNATAYGVSPMLRFDLVINNLLAWAFTTGTVLLNSDGRAWRPVVHVEDIARAVLTVLEAPRAKVHNQTFNVGSTHDNFRVLQLAEMIADLIPGIKVRYAAGATGDFRCYRVNCDKIHNELDFSTVRSVPEAMLQLYRAFDAYGLSAGEFEGPRYSRIESIKQLLATGKLNHDLRRCAALPELPTARPAQGP